MAGSLGSSACWLTRRTTRASRRSSATSEVARTGLLISRARRALDDEDGARLELEASRSSLDTLGAGADLALLDDTTFDRDSTADRLLTARELQVLRLVARGATNRSIGSELGVSERTVDRHVSNILAKLGVPTRAAATAFAYESDLF